VAHLRTDVCHAVDGVPLPSIDPVLGVEEEQLAGRGLGHGVRQVGAAKGRVRVLLQHVGKALETFCCNMGGGVLLQHGCKWVRGVLLQHGCKALGAFCCSMWAKQ
jgi:hypothetical protein